MKPPMGPPPPKDPYLPPDSDDAHTDAEEISIENETPASDITRPDSDLSLDTEEESAKKHAPIPSTTLNVSSSPSSSQHVTIPYTIPSWSEAPKHPFSIEVLKEGSIIEQLNVSEKGAYMFGRTDLCDFVLEHPTISRFHAVLQFKKDEVYLYDLGSTHGTFVNKNLIKGKAYTEVHVGDVLRFGQSSRLYIFQGPSELMLPERDLNKLRKVKNQEAIHDREASLLRAKEEASLVNGISWGMAEDAIEEDQMDDEDEITWQTYKGKLTERQEKTRNKIIKRLEKVSNMKKEIDAIRAKDISQGGLTEGQQMQIGRNEQRIVQILEELDSLEETLNDSIQESKGARAGRLVGGKTKPAADEEDYTLSDEDEFYDRTKKNPVATKSAEHQPVETADTLLYKREIVSNEIEEKKKILSEERDKITYNSKGINSEDDLDAYMTSLSSHLVVDKTVQIERKLSSLQSELNRLTYLLKIADPTGEAAKRKLPNSIKSEVPKSNQCKSSISVQCHGNKRPNVVSDQLASTQALEETRETISSEKPSKKVDKEANENIPSENPSVKVDGVCESKEVKMVAYTIAKPQWLGATREKELEDRIPLPHLEVSIHDDFVDYKDRKKVLASVDEEMGLEMAAPGLIIRKRKSSEKSETGAEKAQKMNAPTSPIAETMAADAVALLLKHKRGIHAFDDLTAEKHSKQSEGHPCKEKSHALKRALGPARPDFLDESTDYESWVPPKGQTGDGRTSLNDRLGY